MVNSATHCKNPHVIEYCCRLHVHLFLGASLTTVQNRLKFLASQPIQYNHRNNVPRDLQFDLCDIQSPRQASFLAFQAVTDSAMKLLCRLSYQLLNISDYKQLRYIYQSPFCSYSRMDKQTTN